MTEHDVVQDGGCWNCTFEDVRIIPVTETVGHPTYKCTNQKSAFFNNFPVGIGWCPLYQQK